MGSCFLENRWSRAGGWRASIHFVQPQREAPVRRALLGDDRGDFGTGRPVVRIVQTVRCAKSWRLFQLSVPAYGERLFSDSGGAVATVGLVFLGTPACKTAAVHSTFASAAAG